MFTPHRIFSPMFTGLMLVAVGLCTAAPALALEGAISQCALGATAAPYGYLEYLPKGYVNQNGWPLVISLHGAGECGNGNGDLPRVAVAGPFAEMQQSGRDFPAVVLAPQATIPAGKSLGWFWYGTVDKFITAAKAKYRIDPNRIYLMGYSAGAKVTWEYANAYPGRVAAIVPMCGLYQDTDSTNPLDPHRLIKTAVWAFHAFDDGANPRSHSIKWVDGITTQLTGKTSDVMGSYPSGDRTRVANGTYTASYSMTSSNWSWAAGTVATDGYAPLFTMYASGGHGGGWVPTYKSQAMWDWLFRQANTAPTVSAITAKRVAVGGTTGTVPFTVCDRQISNSYLAVTVTSSNPNLTPATGLVLGGSGTNRLITVNPAAGLSGSSTITITVSDGVVSSCSCFVLTAGTLSASG